MDQRAGVDRERRRRSGTRLAVNLLGLYALSAATSAGFLIVYAAVNIANACLAEQTQSYAWISILATVACVAALGTMVVQFAADAATRSSAYAAVAIILIALLWEVVFRLTGGHRPEVLPPAARQKVAADS